MCYLKEGKLVTQIHNWNAVHKKHRFLLLDSKPNLKGIQRCAKVLKGYFRESVCDLRNMEELKNKYWALGAYDAVVIRCSHCEAETLNFIEQLKRNLKTLPVILLSPKASQICLIKAFKIGIDDYMKGYPNTLWRVPLKIEKIMERNELSKRLRGERDFSKRLIENANAMIIAVDFNGNALLFNRKIEKCTGYSRDEILGRNLFEILIPKEKRKELYGLLLSYKNERVIPVMDTQFPLNTKDGRILLTSWNANGLRDYDGQTIGMIGVGHDITAMKRLEERLHVSEKLRALGELASGVAHHFNNLLGIVLRRTEVLEKRLTGRPNLISDLEVIRRASLDGAQTVKRIQNFAKQEKPLLNAVDLNEIIQEVVEITSVNWRDDAHKAGIRIQVDSTFSKIPKILGNAPDLKELFTNFILNAVDAMPTGGRIFLETRLEDEVVVVICRDEGLGMDKETLQRIFDPFFTTKGNKGNGLGLSLAYDIVRKHKGEISVVSESGKGAEFKISFPQIPSKDFYYPDQKPLKRSKKPVGKHILLIDDEEDYRTSTAELLKDYGHTVYTAGSGMEALSYLGKKNFKLDIVLSDLIMPDMSGWDVIDKIKSKSMETKVIVVSGHGGFLENKDIKKHLIDYVLSKPCTVDQVQAAIEKVNES